MRSFVLLSAILLFPVLANTQYICEAFTSYSDSFREWEFSADFYNDQTDEWYDEQGSIRQIFTSGNNWSEWRLEIGDIDVECRLKWKNNPNHWVMYTPEDLITIRTVWRDDMRKWKIVSSVHSISIETRYQNLMDEWVLNSKSIGKWKMFTDREGDPRFWIIEDDLSSSIDIYHKLAMVFIVLHHSSPKI